MIRHLLIDFDGTLVRESKVQKCIYLWNCHRYLNGRISRIKLLKTAIQIQKQMLGTDGDKTIASLSELIFQKRTSLSSEWFQTMSAYSLDKITTHPYPEAAGFLFEAKKMGFQLTLATNPIFTHQQLISRLKNHQLNPELFSFLSSSEKMHYIKPDVRYYQELLEKLQLNPGHCLMIGNDARKDLPAEKAGIKVILINKKTHRKSSYFNQHFSEMNHFSEILDYLHKNRKPEVS